MRLYRKIKAVMILSFIIIPLLIVSTNTAYAYDCSAEWVCNYGGQGDLPYSDECAIGFYNELINDPYWDGQFIYGDYSAWERDWKDPSRSGHDDVMVDNTHFAFFAGHGNEEGFIFGSSVDDQQLRYTDALWGNTNLDWITIDACKVLDHTTIVNWLGSFEGLHSICGWDTPPHSSPTRGERLAKYIDGTWDTRPISEAWILAGKWTEDPTVYIAVLAADADGSTSTLDCWNDYIYGHGSQINPPVNPPFWWYSSYPCERPS